MVEQQILGHSINICKSRAEIIDIEHPSYWNDQETERSKESRIIDGDFERVENYVTAAGHIRSWLKRGARFLIPPGIKQRLTDRTLSAGLPAAKSSEEATLDPGDHYFSSSLSATE